MDVVRRHDFVTGLWIMAIWFAGVAVWKTIANSNVQDGRRIFGILPDSTAWEVSTYALTFVTIGLGVPLVAGIVVALAARNRSTAFSRWWLVAVTAWWVVVALVAIGDLAIQGPTLYVTGGDRDPIQDSGRALGMGLIMVTVCLLASLVTRAVRAALEGRNARDVE